jgi:hypothetical protein
MTFMLMKKTLDSETNINNRLELLKQKNLPIFFGNSSSKCRYFDESKPFLDVISFRGLSVCA